MSLTPKEIYVRTKKRRINKRHREAKQQQIARRAQYLTETGRFDELVSEGLPRVYSMEVGNGQQSNG